MYCWTAFMSFINSLYFLFLTYNLCLDEIRRRRTLFLMELLPVCTRHYYYYYYYDIRLDVMGNENQNMDQDALVSYIESKEAGKRSISRISSSQSPAVARSSYCNQMHLVTQRTYREMLPL